MPNRRCSINYVTKPSLTEHPSKKLIYSYVFCFKQVKYLVSFTVHFLYQPLTGCSVKNHPTLVWSSETCQSQMTKLYGRINTSNFFTERFPTEYFEISQSRLRYDVNILCSSQYVFFLSCPARSKNREGLYLSCHFKASAGNCNQKTTEITTPDSAIGQHPVNVGERHIPDYLHQSICTYIIYTFIFIIQKKSLTNTRIYRQYSGCGVRFSKMFSSLKHTLYKARARARARTLTR